MTYSYFVDISSWFFIVFLAATMLSAILNNTLDWLNSNKGDISKKLKALHSIHPLMKKYFSRQKVNKALKYNEEHEKFSDFTDSINSSLVSASVIFGLAPFTIHFLLGLGLNTYIAYVVFFLLSSVASTLVSVPMSYYQTFVIEEKNGFNKTTRKTFFLDIVKSVLVSTVITSVLMCILNFVLIRFRFDVSNAMWLVGVFAAFGLLMESLGFTFMKMFNKFSPLKDKALNSSLKKLFAKAGYRNPKVYVMDSSKRSTHSNAFVCGLGRNNKKIVLFDTMLKNFTKDEILSVLAHEIGHAKLGHLLIHRLTLLVETVVFVSVLTCLMYSVPMMNSFGYSWITEDNIQRFSLLGFMTASMLMGPFKSFLSPLSAKISRMMEYAADRYSVKLTGKRLPLQSALIKLTSENLGDPFPNGTYEAFNYDHPSLGNRLKAIGSAKTKMK